MILILIISTMVITWVLIMVVNYRPKRKSHNCKKCNAMLGHWNNNVFHENYTPYVCQQCAVKEAKGIKL